MNTHKIALTIGAIGLFTLTLVGCEQSSTTGTNNSMTNFPNKVASFHGNGELPENSVHESTSLTWIQVISPLSDQKVKPGLKLHISGQLSRVQRESSIQVTLYQSLSTQYDKNGIALVKLNIPVNSSAAFDGSLVVPYFSKYKGDYFTLVFRYHWVQGDFVYPLGK